MTEPDAIEKALQVGDNQVAAGRLAEAAQTFTSTIQLADAQADARIIRALHGLGFVQERLGEYAQAAASFQRSIVIAEAALGENHALTSRGLNHMALIMRLMGQSAEARPIAAKALKIAQMVGAGSDAAAAENSLALIALDMGDAVEAIRRLTRVVSMSEGLRGERHPDVAAALGNLGDLYRRLGREAEALPILQRAFVIMQEVVGSEGFALGTPLNNLALTHDAIGDYVLAEPLFKQAIQIWSKTLEATNPLLLGGQLNLANLYRKQGRYDDAEPMFRAIIAAFDEAGHPNHEYVGIACTGLADLLKWTERPGESEAMLHRAAEIRGERG